MKRIVIMGVLSFLVSCFSSKNNTKKREKLQARIAEITTEKFEIISFSGNANAGDLDFSKYRSWLKWTEDPNVKFPLQFKYKGGEILLKQESFTNAFNDAREDVFNSYKLIDLWEKKFSDCKLKSRTSLKTEHTILVFLEEDLRDTNHKALIDEWRIYASQAMEMLSSTSVRLKVNIVRDLTKIPSSEGDNHLYDPTEGDNGYMYASVAFKYSLTQMLKNDSIVFVNDHLSYNNVEGYAREVLHPEITKAIKVQYEDKKVAISSVKISGDIDHVDDAKLTHLVEWQAFTAGLQNLVTGEKMPAVKGEVNVYTNHVRISD